MTSRRPLLILPAPGVPEARRNKSGGSGRLHFPPRERQAERLAPRFAVLQAALAARKAQLRADATGLAPEEVLALETVGPVEDFMSAVRNVDGLEWLAELDEDDIPPDDDFFDRKKDGTKLADKALRGRMFLVFSNQTAMSQLLSIWNDWKMGNKLTRGLGKWGDVFSQLHDIRTWGVEDRLLETGVLQDWAERVQHGQDQISCEVELWCREDARRRQAASARVTALVQGMGGVVLHESIIPEILYHGLLVKLPIGAVRTLIDSAGHDASLLQCEQIQFFRATGQMATVVHDGDLVEEGAEAVTSAPLLGEPVVALFDGLPLQGHRRLAGRLVVDDPDRFEDDYQASERRHGTAMASLIVHGDLARNEAPLTRKLYVRPIMRPSPRDWRHPREESVPEEQLAVDLLYRAVRRLFEEERDEPPAARQVCVINLSIGVRDRPFYGAQSPLARLLDWLAWEYQVLFVVSAGNHAASIEVGVPSAALPATSPDALQAEVLRAIAAATRHRRLLSPGEASNVVTVGAVHDDGGDETFPPGWIRPFVGRELPSVISAHGPGYRRAIKPDILLAGGRVALQAQPGAAETSTLEIWCQSRPPGQRVAAPGVAAGQHDATWHTRGTSNATALASRAACTLHDVIEDLRGSAGGELIDVVPRAVWLKALLVHGASWGGLNAVLTKALRTKQNAKNFREYASRLVGYGVADPSRVQECTAQRVTALGGGLLQADKSHIHRFPLPPSLSAKRGLRRLIITLAWLTPVNPAHHGWRRADLWFTPKADSLKVSRSEADGRAVGRGTTQHEVLEGKRAVAFSTDGMIEIQVNCRPDAGALEVEVPYALAVTLEVAEEVGIEIYEEVRVRLQSARVDVVLS